MPQRGRGRTVVDVGVEVAVFLGVRSDLAVVLVDEDAHFRQQLHLLLVQVIRRDFRHFSAWSQSCVTAGMTEKNFR